MAQPLDFAYDFGDPDDYRTFVSRGWTLVPNDEANTVDVQLGAASYPKRFETYVTSKTDDFVCLIMFLSDDESNEIRIAGVLSPTSPIDEAIRRITNARPLAWWKQHGILGLAFSKERVPADDKHELYAQLFDLYHEESGLQEVKREYARERHPAAAPSRERRRMSDALSEEVAAVYRAAWAAGEHPTQAVARHFDKPVSTAGRWVGEARKRGHLGPADGSRGGEAKAPLFD